MSTDDIDTPPPGSRLRVRRLADGFQITLPPAEAGPSVVWWPVAALWFAPVVGCLLCGVVQRGETLALYLRHAGSESLGLLCALGGYALAGAGLVVGLILKAPRPTIFRVTGDGLEVERPGVVWFRTWRWGRDDIRAIGAWGALWVVGPDRKACFYVGCTGDELRWVARLVGRALRVPEAGPSDPDALAVSYRCDHWDEAEAGYLHVRPGELVLRPDSARHPPTRFRADTGNPLVPWFHRLTADPTVTVAPEEVTCRIQEDGQACLFLAPSGSRVEVFVWCQEYEALQRAIARFFGSSEEFWSRPAGAPASDA